MVGSVERGLPGELIEERLIVLAGGLMAEAGFLAEAVGAGIDERIELKGFPFEMDARPDG